MKRLLTLLAAVMMLGLALPAFGQAKKYPQPILAEKSDIWGYAYDRDKKQLVLNYIYEEANEFDGSNGQAIVKYKGFYGVIDTGGTFILEPKYKDVVFNGADYGTYTVKEKEKYTILTVSGKPKFTTGDPKVKFEFDNIGPTVHGWYEGEKDGEWVYVSPEGKITTNMSDFTKWVENYNRQKAAGQ